MDDQVIYQLGKAETALRDAIKYGADCLSGYQLENLVDAIKNVENTGYSLEYSTPSKLTKKSNSAEDKMWEELKQRTIGMPGFKFSADAEFIPASQVSE